MQAQVKYDTACDLKLSFFRKTGKYSQQQYKMHLGSIKHGIHIQQFKREQKHHHSCKRPVLV